jgi:hypothetical protein
MKPKWMIYLVLSAIVVACTRQQGGPRLGPVATLSPPASSSTPAPSTASSQSAPGPYTTIQAAEAYLGDKGPGGLLLTAIMPAATWRPSAMLHVLHATYATGASYAGDYYFFFVDGQAVGMQYFTASSSSIGVDDSTYAITYAVYRSGDPHCCPAGGQTTVRFHWDGASLVRLDPMPGPAQA